MQFITAINRCFTAIIFLLIIPLLFTACKTDEKYLPANTITRNTKIIIELQPLKDIPAKEVSYIYDQLKKLYPNIILNKTIEIPASCYYKPRNRYRADSIINYLSQPTTKDHVIIGLTDLDISTTKNEIKDFGVMGLGFQPGNACVASSFRLSKQNKPDQFFKIAIHELGHTQGLPHCSVKTCFMRDAEGKNPTNEEKEFCSSCKTILEKKGWQF